MGETSLMDNLFSLSWFLVYTKNKLFLYLPHMMQPRQRALAFLGGVVVLIGLLVVIWQLMPSTPASVAPVATITPPTQNTSSSETVVPDGANMPDGKGKPTTSNGALVASTTQDLPFVDLPGRREGNLCDSGDFICISNTYRNVTVTNPLTVTGTALVFEGRISWKLLLGNGDDRVLASGVIQADHAAQGVPASFTLRSFFPDSMASANGAATLVLFEVSLKDGQPIHTLRVPVRVSGETSTIKVFAAAPATGTDCKQVAPVSIRIPRTSLPIEASLQRLLTLRPTPERPSDINSIPDGTKLLSFSLKDGIATAVFSRELDNGVAGSCLVQGIREQITRTLLQFPSVQKANIIADGKTVDTTLQP